MSGVEKDGGAAIPAFPVTAGQHVYATGMSQRDWLAGLAMAATIASERHSASISEVAREKNVMPPELLATIAYKYADAMLAVRGDAP